MTCSERSFPPSMASESLWVAKTWKENPRVYRKVEHLPWVAKRYLEKRFPPSMASESSWVAKTRKENPREYRKVEHSTWVAKRLCRKAPSWAPKMEYNWGHNWATRKDSRKVATRVHWSGLQWGRLHWARRCQATRVHQSGLQWARRC